MIIEKLKFVGKIIEGSSFWSNLASSFIVASLIGLFLPTYLSYIKRPRKFEFFFRESGTDKLDLINNDNKVSYKIELAFRHLSGETFNHDIYWHLFIPSFIKPVPRSIGPASLPTQKEEASDGEEFIHFSGKMPGPIFTETTHWFHYEFFGSFNADDIQIPDSKIITVSYFFSTEYGNYPKNFKQNLKTGLIDIKTTNKLHLHI